MRNIVFEPQAFQDFNNWAKEDKKVYGKIVGLIDDILRNPFGGIGKPEPLKYVGQGELLMSIAWSIGLMKML